MILYPNAKINIGLNILNKREDNYHDISSIFYPVNHFYDILEVVPSDKFIFTSSGIVIPSQKNICELAFEIISSDFELPTRVKIHLHKQIPIGAGLGGGSSDASYTLIAINTLFDLGLTDSQLKDYAIRLGCDCPFFIENKPKHITGVGDKMCDVRLDLSEYIIKFVNPHIHISTSEYYQKCSPKFPLQNLRDLIDQPVSIWKSIIKNDFEDIVFCDFPEIKEMKLNLYAEGAVFASMTGSGSVLFGLFKK